MSTVTAEALGESTADMLEPAEQPEGGMSIHQFHLELATELFNHVLALLERTDRTCAENDRMIHAAHASRFHYDFGGAPMNIAIGEWLCARVHTVLKQTDSALYHAWRYLEHAESYGLGPFHLAYAHAALHRALLARDIEKAARQYELAQEMAQHVTSDEERKVLEREFAEIDGKPLVAGAGGLPDCGCGGGASAVAPVVA